jgi:hypothetical protein
MKFAKGNQYAAKPKWTADQIKQFQSEVRRFREHLNYSNQDLARRLDYSIKYVRMMQGDFASLRQPSQVFISRFREFQASDPAPRRVRGARLCEIVSTLEIPAGTLLPANAEIFTCKNCGFRFIRMNRRREFHSTLCRQKAWRKKLKSSRDPGSAKLDQARKEIFRYVTS